MSEKHLHIISLDVPFPANYGGVIDIFYKAKALSSAGVKVHLHCFTYGREPSPILDFCYEVHYYSRDKSWKRQLGIRPYIVTSRQSKTLINNLLKDNYPILCEGLHTTSVLSDHRFSNRKIYVRTHNVEHHYYRMLWKREHVCWKRFYYLLETAKLKYYEEILGGATAIFPISRCDATYFKRDFENVFLLPAFADAQTVSSMTGRGKYVLYHGNLSVSENSEAACWLLENVFAYLEVPCIIAGLNPTEALLSAAKKYSNVEVCANIDETTMRSLLQNAQVNLLITNQPTGLKLKLLNALCYGRFCVVNTEMIAGSDLQELCVRADDAPTMIEEVNRLMQSDFTANEIAHRQEIFAQKYDPIANAQMLIRVIFD